MSSWNVCDQHKPPVQGAPQCLRETPWSHHWHQLDLAITRHVNLSSVLHTSSYHSAECNTDHSPVANKVRLMPKKLHHSKTKGCPCINTCCTAISDRVHKSADTLVEAIENSTCGDETVESKWSHLYDTIYNSATAAFGKNTNTDWYKVHWEEMEPVTEVKRKDLLAYKRPLLQHIWCPQSCKYQDAEDHSSLHQRLLAEPVQKLQNAADTDNAKGMYNGVKEVTGLPAMRTTLLKTETGEVITDLNRQLECWMNCLKMYATQNVVSDAALEALPLPLVMEELDSVPTVEELSKAINCFAGGKALGKDGIPPEVLKSGKSALLQHLHELLCLCWEKGYMICMMPTLSYSTRTKVTTGIVTTTVESPF